MNIQIFGTKKCNDTKKAECFFKERGSKDQDALALIKYFADEDKLEKILENPSVIKTPVVRNGKQSTLGYQPEVWKGYESLCWRWLQLYALLEKIVEVGTQSLSIKQPMLKDTYLKKSKS